MTQEKPETFVAYNYCISFLDLLGQRAALEGQGLLPSLETPEEQEQFQKVLKDSVGAIVKLQEASEDMLGGAEKEQYDSKYRESLPEEHKATWDEMLRARVSTQRWSDGLVSFVNLGDQSIKCPLNGIFNLFASAGGICFLGLASKRPVRGAIDTAWGMEIRNGELYGAAVARAYELESAVAQYPRIVVSRRTIQFLEAHKRNPETDVFSSNNRAISELILRMLARDTDGVYILNYLGDEFRKAVTQDQHVEIYTAARAFVEEQFRIHHEAANSKLAFRYAQLMSFFEAHKHVAT